MRAYREASRREIQRPARAKAAPQPTRSEWPLAAAFVGTIALMLLVNALLNAFPG